MSAFVFNPKFKIADKFVNVRAATFVKIESFASRRHRALLHQGFVVPIITSRFLLPALLGAGLCFGGWAVARSPRHALAPVVAAPTPSVEIAVVPSPVDGDAVAPLWRGRVVRHGFTKEKVFALTFDDGPFPRYTREVLAILRENHIRATFFMIGKMVREFPKIAHAVQADGHVIGNHSWAHPAAPRAPQAEVRDTDAILEKTLGVEPVLFRPPYGILDNGLAKVAEQDKQTVVLWNSVGADWSKKATTGSIASQIIKMARPGGIALLHDGGGDRSATVAALPRIIRELSAKGYRFVTVPELLAMSKLPQPQKPRKAKPHAAKKAGAGTKTKHLAPAKAPHSAA